LPGWARRVVPVVARRRLVARIPLIVGAKVLNSMFVFLVNWLDGRAPLGWGGRDRDARRGTTGGTGVFG
jgi:hypothetical protein